MSVKLWLDDIRDPTRFGRHGWLWVKTYEAAVEAFQRYDVVEASLDHDLGDDASTGYDVVRWMEHYGVFPRNGVIVHTMNPVGRSNMVLGLLNLCRVHGFDANLIKVDVAKPL